MDDQQKRLFLALLLCAGVALLWQMFMVRPPPPMPAEGTGSVAQAGTGQQPAPSAAAPANPPAAAEGTGATLPAEAAQAGTAEAPQPEAPAIPILPPQRLQGRDFSIEISNRGATLSAVNVEAPEQYVPREEFGVFPSEHNAHPGLGVTIGGLDALTTTSAFTFVPEESHALDQAGDTPVYDRLVYRWSNGRIQVDKIFSADPSRSYVTRLQIAVRDLTGAGQAFSDLEVHLWANGDNGQRRGLLNPVANTIQAACYVNDDLESALLSKAQGKVYNGATRWAGVMDRYFLTAAAVPDGGNADGCHFDTDATYLDAVLRLPGVHLGPGEETRIDLFAYTGPKAEDALSAAGSDLGRSVNYGIFAVLAVPMRWILTRFHGVVANWGVAIIFLTVVVKLLMFPWTQRSFRSMERMREIQPQLVSLREKYQNDRSKLTEETMKLYREHNVNPLGCLPMLLQMPIYIALYRTIYSSVELYKAGFALWITDLSQADPYYVLPVLMTATMFTQQLLMPTTVDNPQMKWVMRLMPVMFGVFMLVLPSGLVLYIFVSSLLGILQQYVIRRGRARERVAVAAVVASDAARQTRQQRRNAARRQS